MKIKEGNQKMNLKELLNKTLKKGYYTQYQLLIQHYGLIEGYSIETEYYTDTPIMDQYYGITEEKQEEFIVLIPFHKPIDIGRNWKNWNVQTIVVATKKELLKHYSEEQLSHWLIWLDEEVRKEVRKCL